MRAGLPKNVQALVDLVTDSAPCTQRDCRACERVPKRPWMGTGLVSHQIIHRIRSSVGKAHEQRPSSSIPSLYQDDVSLSIQKTYIILVQAQNG
jgi:hypothetical protein